MSYPFSINKKANIKCDTTVLIRIFKFELNKLEGSRINVKGNEIEIIECIEFSSKGLRLKNLNKGKITFEQNNGIVNIKSKIILFEHLILFALVVVFGAFGIKHNKEEPEIIGITIILFLIIFVFCYLMPLITFYSFFNETIKKVLTKVEPR